MLSVLYKILVLLYCLLILEIIPKGHNYEPPGTATYPLGDESLNNDILNNPRVSETTQKDFRSYKSSCTQSSSGTLNDPHVSCLGDIADSTTDVLFTTNILTPSPELSCKRCDLQVKQDKKGVIVHCYECYDLPSTRAEINGISSI